MDNTLSGSGDVLPKLDWYVSVLGKIGSPEQAADLAQVRAVVAELIERASALRSAHCAFQDWKAKAPKRYPAPRSILEMNAHAKAMLFAALDRVGGAK